MAAGVARIAALHVYPVKGCRSIELREATLMSTGIQWDRNWMFVSEAGRFLTQRQVPALARIEARVEDDELLLHADGYPGLRIALGDAGMEGEPMTVKIGSDACWARRAAIDTRQWLEGLTGHAGQLVRAVNEQPRVSSPAFTGADRGEVLFADAYALLLTSRSSLADLNRRLEDPLPMSRFRPNLVIEGLGAFAEDEVEWLHRDSMRLKLVKPCTRCVVTTTDQVTGERRGEEPLRTLRTFRWLPALRGVAFGTNAIVVGGAGRRIAVGEEFHVTWRRQTV